MTPEFELIRHLCKLDLHHQTVNDIEMPNWGELDWDTVLYLAASHGVQGLVAHHVSQVEADNVPEEIRQKLWALGRLTAAANEQLVSELGSIATAFEDSGVNMLVLKGARLLLDVYPCLDMRPMADIDILIESCQQPRAHCILTDLGYKQFHVDISGRQVPFTDTWLRRYEQQLQHYGEYRKRGASSIVPWICIDVHHRLHTSYDSFSLNTDAVIDGSVTVAGRGLRVHTPSPEDFLIHLSTHLYWHTRSIRNILLRDDLKLLRFTDLYQFIKANKDIIDWNRFVQRVKDERIQTPVCYAIYGTEELFDDQVMARDLLLAITPNDFMQDRDGIGERWIFAGDPNIGYWSEPFLNRFLQDDRECEALRAFYEYVFLRLERQKGVDAITL